MSDNMNIPTDQQMSLIESLVKSGMLSPDAMQSHLDQNAPQQENQSSNSIDPMMLQSLIKHASNPDAVPMQDGDKMHPMDAMTQIAGAMQGPKNQGADLATGPQIVSNPPASGLIPRLLGMKQQGNFAQTPVTGLLPNLLGMKNSTPVSSVNYYQTAVKDGIDKFLPAGLPRMPDGTPYVDQNTYKESLSSKKTLEGQGNETYKTLGELTDQGIAEDHARQMLANAVAAGKDGVSSKIISNYMGSERIKSSQQLADARSTMAGVAKLGQALKVGGFDAAQPMAEQADKNLLLVQKAQALIDQIVAHGMTANIIQQAELGRNLAALVASNSGVVTDEGMNSMIPQSALKKFGGWQQYLTNKQVPVDFSGFLPQMQDLVTREKQANVGITNAATQLGINIMGATGQGNRATTIATARNNSPLVGNTAPAQNVSYPPARPKATGAWIAIR